eukprot:366485-Chlamydomonas_euryale.AAC.22
MSPHAPAGYVGHARLVDACSDKRWLTGHDGVTRWSSWGNLRSKVAAGELNVGRVCANIAAMTCATRDRQLTVGRRSTFSASWEQSLRMECSSTLEWLLQGQQICKQGKSYFQSRSPASRK